MKRFIRLPEWTEGTSFTRSNANDYRENCWRTYPTSQSAKFFAPVFMSTWTRFKNGSWISAMRSSTNFANGSMNPPCKPRQIRLRAKYRPPADWHPKAQTQALCRRDGLQILLVWFNSVNY